MKIGIFDSGRGGTTVMSAIQQLLPDDEYFYIADSEHCPYGEKSDAELYPLVTANVEKLRDWGAQIVVVACNTATVRCLDQLRRDFPELKFVGTEPAIKLATATDATDILVLATPGTISSEHVHQLAAQHTKPHQHITLLPCPGLASIIEHHLDTDPGKIDAKLAELLTDYAANTANTADATDTANAPARYATRHSTPDVVVLGCTHYPLILPQLQKYFPTAQFIDGGEGVARQVANLKSLIS